MLRPNWHPGTLSRPGLTLGSEEGFKCAPMSLRTHAAAGVRDFKANVVADLQAFLARGLRLAKPAVDARNRETAAIRHRVTRIESQIEDNVLDLTGSTLTSHGSRGSWSLMWMDDPSVCLRSAVTSKTIRSMAIRCGFNGCCRAKAKRRCVGSAPCSVARMIADRQSSSRSGCSRISSAFPWITAKMLFTSWAIPPVRVPIASIF